MLAQPLSIRRRRRTSAAITARRAVEAAEEFLSWRFGHGRQRSQRDGGRLAGRVGLRRVEHCVRLRRELRASASNRASYALGERFDFADDGLRNHR